MKLRSTLRLTGAAAAAATTLLGTAGSLSAAPKEAVFDANDRTWLCHADGFVAPSHCLNIRSQGNTGLIMVFPPDERGPAEGISGPNAANRPCPHDPAAVDGTWWEIAPDTYVCHHKP